MRLCGNVPPTKDARRVIMKVFCDVSGQGGPSGRGLSTKDVFKRAAVQHQHDFTLATELKKKREQGLELMRRKEQEVEALKMKLEAKRNESNTIGSLLSRLVGTNEPTRTPKQQELNALEAELAKAEAELQSNPLPPLILMPEQNPVKSVTYLKHTILRYFAAKKYIQKVRFIEEVEHHPTSKKGSKSASKPQAPVMIQQRSWRWRLTENGELEAPKIAEYRILSA